ncbi:MAG TPA: YciI family protein [Dehalococcoidia bacterium]|nr:YciI family protein [Dehalococcoidia bacterium]
MQWYVVLSKPLVPREKTMEYAAKNLAWMKEHHEAGRVMFSGRTTEGPGIWILKAGSKEEASELAKTNPWVQMGFRDVSEIYEWTVEQALGVGRFEPPPAR